MVVFLSVRRSTPTCGDAHSDDARGIRFDNCKRECVEHPGGPLQNATRAVDCRKSGDSIPGARRGFANVTKSRRTKFAASLSPPQTRVAGSAGCEGFNGVLST